MCIRPPGQPVAHRHQHDGERADLRAVPHVRAVPVAHPSSVHTDRSPVAAIARDTADAGRRDNAACEITAAQRFRASGRPATETSAHATASSPIREVGER